MLYGWRFGMECSGIQGTKLTPGVFPRPIGEVLEIGEVAASPVAVGSQAVDADRDAGRSSFVLEQSGLIRVIGAEDQPCLGLRVSEFENQLVISEPGSRGQRQEHASHRLAIEVDFAIQVQVGDGHGGVVRSSAAPNGRWLRARRALVSGVGMFTGTRSSERLRTRVGGAGTAHSRSAWRRRASLSDSTESGLNPMERKIERWTSGSATCRLPKMSQYSA